MKLALILIFLSFSTFASPDNLGLYATEKKLPKARFLEILRLFEREFQPLAQADGRKFEILSDYNEDWAQAFARRWDNDQLIVYGGVAALKGGTEDSFALLLCHETGHLYGGEPWSDDKNRLSIEGQADYWSAKCFEQIAPKLNGTGEKRLEKAALVLTSFYADNRNIPHPRIETPDLSEVEVMLRTHPEPQCRLDTILAGMMGNPRPRCWFKP